jgi:acyl-CoA reductase-like NAD-dependent aldehyde dehydrogenase
MNSSKTVPKNAYARHWINGEWVSSSTLANSVNPSSGEVLGQYSAGGRAEATAAIAAARGAFDTGTWAHDPQIRMRALLEIADRLDERAEAIGLMLSREMGKVLRDATLEATWSPATLRYNAGTALSQTGTSAEIAPGVFASAMREPIGVAGIIVPWNSPLALLVRALGPALAAGCTTVVKLPGQTALVNALVMEAVAETKSLPKGVVNIFTESGNEGAPLMVASPDVDAINYTGSTKVGRQVAEQGARTLKRVSLELGGKTPLVVFEDADIETVAPLVVTALTKFNGEFCMTGSRVLVQRSVADAWRKRIASLLEKVVVGRADDQKSEMGPLIDRANVARIDRFVEDAKTVCPDHCSRWPHRGRPIGCRCVLSTFHARNRGIGRSVDPRGDIRPGAELRDFCDRGRSHRPIECHRLRPGRRDLHQRSRSCSESGSRHQGRHCVDQYLGCPS